MDDIARVSTANLRTSDPACKSERRIFYLDIIRVLAIWLVIVNHTDGAWMLSMHSQSINWWFSVIYFFFSKAAVPLFIMVSGALLLNRDCSYRKTAKRIGRVLTALVLFSAFYYLTSTKAPSFLGFVDGFWHANIKVALWYLYMYIGLLVMSPLLKKLTSVMTKNDYLYLFGICLGITCMVPMLSEFYKPLTYTSFFQLPVFNAYIGLFVGGHYFANVATPSKRMALASVVLIPVCLLALTQMTGYFYIANGGVNYLRMDNITFTPIIVMSGCIFVLIRWLSEKSQTLKDESFALKLINLVALCSFGMYLTHIGFLSMLNSWFTQLCGVMPDIAALLLYEIVIFVKGRKS